MGKSIANEIQKEKNSKLEDRFREITQNEMQEEQDNMRRN